jgi:hypothetical protein
MERLIIILFFVCLIIKFIGLFSKKTEKGIDKIVTIFCIVIGLIIGFFII